ncbi:MAG: HAD hydrolase-like protein [Clostridia bacterium]|nr:HAD hydrolase-like protein [Clostridia bacterium]
MKEKRYTHVIWDFNGTILDDVEASIKSADQLLTAHGLPALASPEVYRANFGFPVIDYYRRLGFDFDKIPYEVLAPEWVGYYLENARDAGICHGVREVLAEVQARGIPQLILSATERGMLRSQVEALGILPYFEDLLGMGDIHAHSKEQVAVEWRRANPDARVLMVGDTDHDAAVASAMGADCVLLTSGHQSRVRLEACKCRFVADAAREILELL